MTFAEAGTVDYEFGLCGSTLGKVSVGNSRKLTAGDRLMITRHREATITTLIHGSAITFACLIGVLPIHASAAQDVDLQTRVEEAATTAVSNCATEIELYCADVSPGEGRMLSCLQAYADRASPLCETSIGKWRRSDVVADFKTTQLYPTLEDRELGEPNLDNDGETVVWNRRLPFMAQQVVDLGFELPNPYGIGLVAASIRQELLLEELAIGIGGPPDREIDFVEFDSPRVENKSVQMKLDAWLLPFLSVFTTVGVFSGDATIPLKFEGSDLFPELCSITPNLPVCVRTYSGVATPSYEGTNITIGFNAAMGWDKFFVAVPVAYAWTDVDFLNETVTALNITPRIGITGDLGERGTLAAFIGATYLDAEVDLTGSISFDTPGGPVGDQTELNFIIRQRNKDQWNYLIGFNWELSRRWSFMAEAGFGGSRENAIFGVNYRF